MKNTRFFSIIFIIFLFFITNILSITISLADDFDEISEDNSTISQQIVETLQANSSEINLPNINSKSAVVIERNSNKVLFGKNENEKRKMASTTKIMTALIVIENCNLDETIEISKKSASTSGSRLGLKTGDKITIKDLLYGLLLKSGNDAAVALAEFTSGDLDSFSNLMNKKAKELNLTNSHFVTPHGLDSENHYTTAYELAILTNYALKNKTFLKIVGTNNYTVTINGNQKNISNTNELLGYLEGVYGVKTGFTNGANRCLVTACKRDNLDIVCVVLGADTKNFRTQDSIKLIEYSFKNFTILNIENYINDKFEDWKTKNIDKFTIEKSKKSTIVLSLDSLENNIIPILKSYENSLNINIYCKKDLISPIFKDSEIGHIIVYSGSEIISKVKIKLDSDLPRKNIFDYFLELFKSYSTCFIKLF